MLRLPITEAVTYMFHVHKNGHTRIHPTESALYVRDYHFCLQFPCKKGKTFSQNSSSQYTETLIRKNLRLAVVPNGGTFVEAHNNGFYWFNVVSDTFADKGLG